MIANKLQPQQCGMVHVHVCIADTAHICNHVIRGQKMKPKCQVVIQ